MLVVRGNAMLDCLPTMEFIHHGLNSNRQEFMWEFDGNNSLLHRVHLQSSFSKPMQEIELRGGISSYPVEVVGYHAIELLGNQRALDPFQARAVAA